MSGTRLLLWIVLGILSIAILAYAYRAYGGDGTESFTTGTGSRESPFPLNSSLRECAVYYTSNVDICNRPDFIGTTEPLELHVDRDDINYYSIGKPDVQSQFERLVSSNVGRTATQNTALGNLRRVLADIDSLPFKNTCKLPMVSLKEATEHPYKINTATEGTDRRGNPIHWSYCYYPTNADTIPSGQRIPPTTRADTKFTRVFNDTQATYTSTSETSPLRRYDMKSLYNDDLLNLHCLLYTTSVLEAGNTVGAFQNTRFMECILNSTDVRSATEKTLRIVKMRPVVIFNGTLILEPNALDRKKAYLKFIELIRTQNTIAHRKKAYPVSVYKLLFQLCNAQPSPIPNSSAMTDLVHDKFIKLAIPKPVRSAETHLLTFKSTYTPELDIYNFVTQPPQGSIDDMPFDVATLDSRL